mgnify:FL=1
MTKLNKIAIAVDSEPDGDLLRDLVHSYGEDPVLITPDTIRHTNYGTGNISGLIIANGTQDLSQNVNSSALMGDVISRLLPTVLDFDLPVLAVGSGIHTLNVTMGGRSARPIPAHGPLENGKSEHHHIFISPGSRHASLVGARGLLRVNSRHILGIKPAQKAPNLLACAYGLDDGVIEAVESPSHTFVIGVQFQPERPREVPPHFERLFEALVDHAVGVKS